MARSTYLIIVAFVVAFVIAFVIAFRRHTKTPSPPTLVQGFVGPGVCVLNLGLGRYWRVLAL